MLMEIIIQSSRIVWSFDNENTEIYDSFTALIWHFSMLQVAADALERIILRSK